LIAVGVALWSLASGASGLAGTFMALLVTRCLVGVGEAAYGPVAPTLIADFFPVASRGWALAWFYMAIPVGSALGYVLGGAVANSGIGAWGSQLIGGPAESWRWSFFLVVPPGLLLAMLCFFMREPRVGQTDVVARPARPTGWRQYRVLLRTPSFVLCTLGMTAMTFAMGGVAFWMPYYLEHQPGAPANTTITFGGIIIVTGLAGTLLGGWMGDKLRARHPGSYFSVSGVGMLLGFPFMVAMLYAPFPWVWVFLFVTSFFLFFNTGPTNTILANVTHPAIRAAGYAVNILIIHSFGDVISPVIIGVLSDRYNMRVAFLLVGLMYVLSGALWLWGARHLARDTELAVNRLEETA
jgi:MFS family permease